MKHFLCTVALLTAPLVASGGALALGCVVQDPLAACLSAGAETPGEGPVAKGAGAVCLRDVDCVALAVAAACTASTEDNAAAACVGYASATCPASLSDVCMPPPPLPCPPNSFAVAYYSQNGILIHVICAEF